MAQARFVQLRQRSNRVFELDKAIKDLPGSTQARQNLVSASLEYLEGLAPAARGDLDLAREIGEGYWRVAVIQRVPVDLSLGEAAKADLSLKKVDDLIESVLAARPQDRIALLRSAEIAHYRMILAVEERRATESVAYAGKAAERLDKFLHRSDVRDSERDEAARAYYDIALTYVDLHRYAQAVPGRAKVCRPGAAAGLPANRQRGSRRARLRAWGRPPQTPGPRRREERRKHCSRVSHTGIGI